MNDDHPRDLLAIVSTLDRLDDLPRSGWLFCGVDDPESIAAHSYGVALVALWLADRVDADIDTGRLLRLALLHDIAEAMLTDLPRPIKDVLGDDRLHRAEDQALDGLLGEGDHPWKRTHQEYRLRQSPEARLVKAADQIQMLNKALLYRHRQQASIDDFFADRSTYHHQQFPLVKAVFDHLFDCYSDHRLPDLRRL